MPEDLREIELSNGSRIKVQFVWCFAASVGPQYYPQAVRAWPKERAEKLRPQYERMEASYADRLASMVRTSPRYVFTPPSRYRFASVYLEACKSKNPGGLDISRRFQRLHSGVVASENNITARDVYRSLAYHSAGDEPDIKSILMVDDVVAGGKTTRATFTHLVEAGMPNDANVTVACLLRIGSISLSY